MPKAKARGNGQGTAYKRGKFWEAQVVIGYRENPVEGKQPIPIKRRKGGFKSKAAAIAACADLRRNIRERKSKPLLKVYEDWETSYAPRVSESTMKGYHSAFQHFSPLHPYMIDTITATDLQGCMDSCTNGKRTHQLMKVVAGLIWAYALDSELVEKDVTANLYTGKGESVQREPLTNEEVEVIRQAIGKEPYAEYIYALCYLGFRPGELLELTKADCHEEDGVMFLVGGKKTKAGKGRKVPVPDQIRQIIQERMDAQGTDFLFPQRVLTRKGEFTGYKQMTDYYFRECVFKPMMKRLGIAEGKVPYSARHTYSDKLKDAAGDVRDKAALMGHTDYDFTRKRYQSTELSDLKAVVDTIV